MPLGKLSLALPILIWRMIFALHQMHNYILMSYYEAINSRLRPPHNAFLKHYFVLYRAA